MEIKKDFLTLNDYSRPGKKLKEVKAIVLHWTANPYADAKDNRDFFENRKTGMGGYGSAHYIVNKDGLILQCIPTDEIAYHCGSGKTDPKSGKLYTDYAREKLGHYCSNGLRESPNFCTIGIEMCPTDGTGFFSIETRKAAAELCTALCFKFGLTENDLMTHHEIVGWKNCPKLWTEKPSLFEAFKTAVKMELAKGGRP